MTTELRYTLLSEGTSDRVLMHVIEWILIESGRAADCAIIAQFADLSVVNPRPSGIAERMLAAVNLYPCDVLFVHRDSDRESPDVRHQEVDSASETVDALVVPVVPVRMMEAWLLLDERAIRLAADNPNGTVDLNLPTTREVERIADPKSRLREALVSASEKSGRQLERFRRRMAHRVHRVAQYIDDFSPLRQLGAFQTLERITSETTAQWG